MSLNFLPMPHKVYIEKTVLDNWGIQVTDTDSPPAECVARVSYNTRNEKLTLASGEHINFTAQILLEGMPSITYEDYIVWTDTAGNRYKKMPVEIMYKHDLAGNPIALRVTV